MMSMPLSEAARVLDATHHGDDVTFHGISTDSRTMQAGGLFVALQGPDFDGHAYLRQAHECGAVAAAVSCQVDEALPLLEVNDTRLALGELASDWRKRFDIPLVAVTGSNGKTTVKEMLAAILSLCGETLATKGNFNNDIGVPLTLARLSSAHQFAVIELGANHAGEIAYLTNLACPTVGIVNNAGPAHLEGFGTLQGVADAKGELFAALSKDAVCVINADDPFESLWQSLAEPAEVIRFAIDNTSADVRADWQGDFSGSEITLFTEKGNAEFHLPLPGKHNVLNALAATAAAQALNIPLNKIVQGLSAVRPAAGRWQVLSGVCGIEVIDDTYNANPGSMQAALDVLAKSTRETWLVLGDMGELGDNQVRLHRNIGEQCRKSGVRRLFTLGALAAEAAAVFGDGAQSYEQFDELLVALKECASADTTLLVKGSRTMRMERVVQALCEADSDSGERS